MVVLPTTEIIEPEFLSGGDFLYLNYKNKPISNVMGSENFFLKLISHLLLSIINIRSITDMIFTPKN